MKENKIIEQTHFLYSKNRTNLINELSTFNWEKSVLNQLYKKIDNQIDRPILAVGGIDIELQSNQFKDKFNDIQTGDISDRYTIVLNETINKITDWNFNDQINSCEEIRYIRIWINWFLPLYYLEVNYEKSIENGTKIEYGSLKDLSKQELNLTQKVENILSSLNFQKCELDFLKQKINGIRTDIVRLNPMLFECLFSDLKYFWDKTYYRKIT